MELQETSKEVFKDSIKDMYLFSFDFKRIQIWISLLQYYFL